MRNELFFQLAHVSLLRNVCAYLTASKSREHDWQDASANLLTAAGGHAVFWGGIPMFFIILLGGGDIRMQFFVVCVPGFIAASTLPMVQVLDGRNPNFISI